MFKPDSAIKGEFVIRVFYSLILVIALVGASEARGAETFIQKFPTLKPFIDRESKTFLRIGFGISPFQLVKDRFGTSLSLFQLHLQYSYLDWEILNTSFGFTIGGTSGSKLRSISLRTSPKFRFN